MEQPLPPNGSQNQNGEAPPAVSIQSNNIPISDRPFKKWIALLIVMIIGAASAVAFGFYYQLRSPNRSPTIILQNAFDKFATSTSWTAHVSFAQTNFASGINATLDFTKDTDQFSGAGLSISGINKENNNDLLLMAVWNRHDAYVNFTYSKMNGVLNNLVGVYPSFSNLNTFRLLQPFLLNQQWLHIAIPTSTSQGTAPASLSASDIAKIESDFWGIFVVKEFDASFSQNNKIYQKITLAIDKDKLVGFLQNLKKYNLNVSLAQINSFMSAITSMNGWGGNILQVLVDQNTEDINEIAISLPKLPSHIIEQTVPSITSPTSTENPIAQLFRDKLAPVSDFLNQSSTNDLQYIGKVDFSNYDKTLSVNPPTSFSEFTNIEIAFIRELPIILATFSSPVTSSSESAVFLSNFQNVKLLWGSGKYTDSLKAAQSLLTIASTNEEKSTTHYWIGLSYYKLSYITNAEQEELLAVKFNKNFNGPYVTLAAISLGRNDCTKAFDYAQTAVNLDPSFAWAHNDLGLAYGCLGNKQQATAELEKAVQLDPSTYTFQYNLNFVKQTNGSK